jgi:hypothetical protein
VTGRLDETASGWQEEQTKKEDKLKKLSGFSVAVAGAGLCLFLVNARPVHGAIVAPEGYFQDHGRWDNPPAEMDEMHRKGFHDGVEGARKDFDNHRSPDPHNRDEFRHPHVPDHDREAYRQGFERGYQSAWDHYSSGH